MVRGMNRFVGVHVFLPRIMAVQVSDSEQVVTKKLVGVSVLRSNAALPARTKCNLKVMASVAIQRVSLRPIRSF